MNTKLPKVLHEVCGRPMLAYVLDACRSAGVHKVYCIVGYGKEQVIERFSDDRDIVWIEQNERKGTGHAVMCCKDSLKDFDGDTLVICGDMPLIRDEILKTIISEHEQSRSTATLATAVIEDPSGYGRIVRDQYGNIKGIVEHNDCSPEQLKINEVNPSYYCFNNRILFDALDRIKPDNAKGEYYLTDALHIVIEDGHKTTAVTAVKESDAIGVNDRQQLSEASRIMQSRVQENLMDSGVTIVDPPNTWIDARAKIGQDTVIEPFTYIHGEVNIGCNCRIGPFAHLRNGTTIEDDVVLGVFTEVKDSILAQGVRARHHSYIGNAKIGKNVNVGAGAITANYDGENVNDTQVGDDCFIAPGAILVAPLKMAGGSHTQPGSVVVQKEK